MTLEVKMCKHGQPALCCPFCVLNRLEEQNKELERKLAVAEAKIEELTGTIDGLRERCELINA